MCGICGVVRSDRSRPVEPELLRRMTGALLHRGPDSEGFHVAPGVGLGVRRLSIIDLETGDQPIANEDGTVVIVCNGEIYNHVELRGDLEARGHRFRTRSDVEVIVHLYEDLGPAAAHRLRGMFAFALWDARRRLLLLVRDRLGIKPLVYSVVDGDLHFASESKALLAGGAVEVRLDPGAVEQLFEVGFVLSPRTFFEGVHRLPAGHRLLFRNGSVAVERYWSLPIPVRRSSRRRAAAEWSEGLRAKLDEAVRLHMRSDVPVGALLSSGLDSSAVAALMMRHTHQPVRAIRLAFTDPEYDEVGDHKTLESFPGFAVEARTTAFSQTDFDLLPLAVWHVEEPSTRGLEIPRLLLSRAAAVDRKVVLTGEGADEVLGGYGWYRLEKVLRPLLRLPEALRRAMNPPLLDRRRPWVRRGLLAPREMGIERFAALTGAPPASVREWIFAPDFSARFNGAPQWTTDAALPSELRGCHPLDQLQHVELHTRLPDYVNHLVDRLSMAASLEIRLPFLDHEVVAYGIRIPPSLKVRRLTEKYVLRRAMTGVLPAEILARRKHGLAIPHRKWLRGDLPEFARELLSSRSLREKGYFDERAVGFLLRDHRNGAEALGDTIFGVLAVQLWDEIYARGWRPAAAP